MTNNNHGHKIAAAGTALLIAEPALAFAHTGGVGVIVGLGLAAAAYVFADDIAAMTGRAQPSPSSAVPVTEKLPTPDKLDKFSNLGYRLLNGKSVRETQETRLLPENEVTQILPQEDDDDINFPAQRSSFFTLSEVLKDFKPSLDRIYLGEKEDGTPIFCSARKLFHIALAGKTGRGKGSLMRLLLAQLCACRVELLLLNPHYMDWVYTDSGDDEDWTPFKPYFKVDPNDCVGVPAIEKYLRWAREVLLEKRKTKARNGQRPGKPFFIVIDELPSIIDESKICADYISKLTNEGRKYGIFLIVASQNFQVKAVSGNTAGADRENYETCYYVGGDGTTAKVLLDMPVNQIPETSLGKGVAMLRCAGSLEAEKAVKVRVPFTDNEALYRLLGPSTFKRQTAEDDLSFTDLFEQMRSPQVQEDEIVDSPGREPMQPLPMPVVQERGPRAADIDLGGAIALWNAGYNSENKLMKVYPGLTKNQANKLRERILGQANARQEEAE